MPTFLFTCFFVVNCSPFSDAPASSTSFRFTDNPFSNDASVSTLSPSAQLNQPLPTMRVINNYSDHPPANVVPIIEISLQPYFLSIGEYAQTEKTKELPLVFELLITDVHKNAGMFNHQFGKSYFTGPFKSRTKQERKKLIKSSPQFAEKLSQRFKNKNYLAKVIVMIMCKVHIDDCCYCILIGYELKDLKW